MDNQKKPVIGKYVIENLTTGMYADARSVYREYIQNSADAIDKAVEFGIMDKNHGEIHVEIDETRKQITFYDNGTGIPIDKVEDMLQNIAQSEKEIGKDKGFRGIGRLGGLAYCNSLIFETSSPGEEVKSIMAWDAKKLREHLSDRENKEDAVELIMAVTAFHTEPERKDEHYFRVIMNGVDHQNLLNTSDIREYLRFVAPVPFDRSFIFRSKIYEEMEKDELKIDEYTVFVNTEQIFKGYKTFLYKENNGVPVKIGEITDVVVYREFNKDGTLLFWCWHTISDIQNIQLTKINKGRGLRLRKHNIQIGDEHRLDRLFKDTRFNFYVFGEVHAFDKNLVPNGRRDDFEANSVYLNLQQKLKPVCAEIDRLSNRASDIHSANRKVNAFLEFKQQIDKKQKEGVTNRDELNRIENELKQKKDQAETAVKTLHKFKEIAEKEAETPLAKIFKQVVKEEIPKVNGTDVTVAVDKPVFRTEKLTRLTRAERKLMSEVYGVIQNVLPIDLADNLIKKIEEKFK